MTSDSVARWTISGLGPASAGSASAISSKRTARTWSGSPIVTPRANARSSNRRHHGRPHTEDGRRREPASQRREEGAQRGKAAERGRRDARREQAAQEREGGRVASGEARDAR